MAKESEADKNKSDIFSSIAALVGTSGLGQQVYIGLGDGNFGLGMTAGIGMAIIAMLADRLIQAWSKKRQSELGLKSD